MTLNFYPIPCASIAADVIHKIIVFLLRVQITYDDEQYPVSLQKEPIKTTISKLHLKAQNKKRT